MKKLGIVFLALTLLLSACGPRFEREEEIVQDDKEEKKEKAIIPKYRVSDSLYQTILPFKPSETRGLVSGYIYNRLDVDEFESGLMRIATETFDPQDYFFKEGEFLEEKDVAKWIDRKPLKEGDEKERGVSKEGLNPAAPVNPQEGELEKINKESPQYLSYVMEHDYYKKNKDGEVELAGMAIGLSMNSVHYYKQEQGYPREYKIPFKDIEAQGKKIAQEVVERMRNKDGVRDVPIVVALFVEEAKNAVAPGNFFAKTTLNSGKTAIDKWEKVDENYYFFPSDDAEKDHREDALMFSNFKTDIEEYFPNYIGVIGRGFYKGDELAQLSIDIPMQFYGKAEVIGFTQYVTGKVLEHVPEYISVQVYISSIDKPEALIVRNPGDEKPFVHIYQ